MYKHGNLVYLFYFVVLTVLKVEMVMVHPSQSCSKKAKVEGYTSYLHMLNQSDVCDRSRKNEYSPMLSSTYLDRPSYQ